MDLIQSLRERLIAIISKSIYGDQSVYGQIVYQLEELQRLRQELVRKAESDNCEDPKTCERTIENVKNNASNSIKSLLTVFKNKCVDRRQIMNTKTCVFDHISEIELRSNVDLNAMLHQVRNTMIECVTTKNNISAIVVNHGGFTDKTNTFERRKNNIENTVRQLKHQKRYYTDIIKELKMKVLSVEKDNQITFTEFSQITSNTMNLKMKYDCIRQVRETSLKTYNKIYDFEDICQSTGDCLDIKINDCESNLSVSKKNWESLISEWNDFKIQSDVISDSISENTNKLIETNKLLDEIISQKIDQLQNLNNNYQTNGRLKLKIEKRMISSKQTLEKLRCTLSNTKKTRDTYTIQSRGQDAFNKKQLNWIMNYNKAIDDVNDVQKKKIVELNYVDNGDNIDNGYEIYEYDFASNEEFKSYVLRIVENTKRIDGLKAKTDELRRCGRARSERMKRERRENEENRTSTMKRAVENGRLSLDLARKTMDGVRAAVSRSGDLLAAAVRTNDGLDDCTKALSSILRNTMVDNYGKTLAQLTQDGEELTSANTYYAARLRNVRAESESQMEALLEERIRLLQDRMKAIADQREQIERANRGLEEELDKLSKNVVRMSNNFKITDETEEEKPN